MKKSIALLRTALCVSAIALPARAEPPKLPILPLGNTSLSLPSAHSVCVQQGDDKNAIIDARIAKLIGLKRKQTDTGTQPGNCLQRVELATGPAAHPDWLDVALQAKKATLQAPSMTAEAAPTHPSPRLPASEPARLEHQQSRAAAPIAKSTAENSFIQNTLTSVPTQTASSLGDALLQPASATSDLPVNSTASETETLRETASTEDDSLLSADFSELPPMTAANDTASLDEEDSLISSLDASEPDRLPEASISASSGSPRPLLQVQVGNVVATAEICRLTDNDPDSPVVQLANPMKVASDRDPSDQNTYNLSDADTSLAQDGPRLSNLVSPPSGDSSAVLSSRNETAQSSSNTTKLAASNEETAADSENDSVGSVPSATESESLLSVPASPIMPAETDTPEFELGPIDPQQSLIQEAPPAHPITHSMRDESAGEPGFAGVISQTTENTTRQEIEVAARSSKSIEIPGAIVDFAIENDALCKAMKVNSSALTLIGLRGGQTRLAVRYEDESGNVLPKVYLLNISSPNMTNSSDLELAIELTKTIKSIYPASKVEIGVDRGTLIVRGTAASEEDAQAMLNLVRRTTLRPVVDRLVTRR